MYQINWNAFKNSNCTQCCAKLKSILNCLYRTEVNVLKVSSLSMWAGQKSCDMLRKAFAPRCFSKSHIQQHGFKREETAKYLEVTRQSLPMLSRRCISLANL